MNIENIKTAYNLVKNNEDISKVRLDEKEAIYLNSLVRNKLDINDDIVSKLNEIYSKSLNHDYSVDFYFDMEEYELIKQTIDNSNRENSTIISLDEKRKERTEKTNGIEIPYRNNGQDESIYINKKDGRISEYDSNLSNKRYNRFPTRIGKAIAASIAPFLFLSMVYGCGSYLRGSRDLSRILGYTKEIKKDIGEVKKDIKVIKKAVSYGTEKVKKKQPKVEPTKSDLEKKLEGRLGVDDIITVGNITWINGKHSKGLRIAYKDNTLYVWGNSELRKFNYKGAEPKIVFKYGKNKIVKPFEKEKRVEIKLPDEFNLKKDKWYLGVTDVNGTINNEFDGNNEGIDWWSSVSNKTGFINSKVK
jgi:hypothetical protein